MGTKILLIDDDVEMSSIIKDALVAAGYQVEIWESGLDAMKTILACKPDLLLLDVMLPGIDGYTLAMQITENDATRDLPIIVLSGLEPSQAMFRRFRQVAAFMTKPFTPEDLLEKIGRALAKKP
ncbi:MAG: response regulator [bacterium]